MNTERLTKLANLLDTVPSDRFDISFWGCHSRKDAPDTLDISQCGTAACAVGWACSLPEFRAAGLTLRAERSGLYVHYAPYFETPSQAVPGTSVTYEGLHAVEQFFDLTEVQAEWLFMPNSYIPDGEDPEDYDGDINARPAEVAARIRKLLSKGAL